MVNLTFNELVIFDKQNIHQTLWNKIFCGTSFRILAIRRLQGWLEMKVALFSSASSASSTSSSFSSGIGNDRIFFNCSKLFQKRLLSHLVAQSCCNRSPLLLRQSTNSMYIISLTLTLSTSSIPAPSVPPHNNHANRSTNKHAGRLQTIQQIHRRINNVLVVYICFRYHHIRYTYTRYIQCSW